MRYFTFCSHEVFAQASQCRPLSSRARHPRDRRVAAAAAALGNAVPPAESCALSALGFLFAAGPARP